MGWTPPWLEIYGFCKNSSQQSNCSSLTNEPDDSHSFPWNWMSCPWWTGIKIPCNNPTATLWQKDQMTPTLTRNWIHCPWWAIRRNTIVARRGDCSPKLNVLPLVGRYYQKLPWGTLPSNSRLILVNCFIHAGLSLIGQTTTTVSFRMCVCVLCLQAEAQCTAGWTYNRCKLHITRDGQTHCSKWITALPSVTQSEK